MFNSFSKSILFAPLLSLLLGGVLVVSCGDDDNEEDVQTSSSDQNGGNGSSDNGNGGNGSSDNGNGGTPAFDGKDKVYTANGVSFTMIAVRGGTFTMGATSEQTGARSNESPTHSVTLSDYYIGETEVTQELWNAVMGSNPSNFGDMQHPVEMVSWDDCQTFISRLNELTGETFRLPTEAQWEYAARGGNKSKGYTYSGSNAIDDVAWYYGNQGGGMMTHPVKTKAPNELGIYDMSGNVCEWCSDWYDFYSSAAQTDPTGPARDSFRVIRGGSWVYGATDCRVAWRSGITPTNSIYYLGLRLAY